MNFEEVIKKRYSCRKFSDKPVERTLLSEIMEAGKISPSACNSQRWLFIAVDDKEKRQQLSDAMKFEEFKVNTFTGDVPAFIAIVKYPARKMNEAQKVLLGGGSQMEDIDIGIAAQQMILTATSKGLGTVAIGWYDRNKVKEILEIPHHLEVSIFIGLGYPADNKERKHIRFPSTELFRFNSYNNNDK